MTSTTAHQPSPLSCDRGFTLIELSIVLMILGLVVGLGAGMMGPLNTYVKVRETREIQEGAVQAVASWASSHNYLPDSAAFPSVSRSTDSWGRSLTYLYDPNLFSATPTKDTVCGRRSTGLSLVSADAVTTANVAFVILSGADSATLKSTLSGTLNGAPINGAVSGTGYASGTVTLTAPNGDLAKWVTLDELRSKMGCQGPAFRIVNNELPFGSVPNTYSVTLTADGGVPFATNPSSYRWCVNTLPAGFAQSGGVQSANCSTLAEAGWAPASAGLVISFPAATVATGAYPITVVARDNADGSVTSAACSSADSGDNCSQKLFVITVNPS